MIEQDGTARFGLPYLAAGQAQKEWTHNEALALVDLALQPVPAAMRDDPPDDPKAGDMWLVGRSPTGAWAGRAGTIAGWTGGGWRHLDPPLGFELRTGTGERRRRDGDGWQAPPAVADPAGGEVIDTVARGTLASLLEILRHQGLIAR